MSEEDRAKRRTILLATLSFSGILANIISKIKGDLWMQYVSWFAIIFSFLCSIYYYKRETKEIEI